MKKIITVILIIVSFYGISKAEELYMTDTIIVEFGNNSRLMIYVDSDEDLKDLEEYDINAMIAELNMSISSSDNAEYLQITDESGSRFLKDTTIQLKDSRVKYYDKKDNDEKYSSWNRDDNDDDDYDSFNDNWRGRDKNRNRTIRTRNSFEIDLGLNNWLEDGAFPDENNQLYAVKPMGSWYVALKKIQKSSVGGPLFINWGGGISWYNWKFENNDVNIIKDPNAIRFIDNNTVDGKKSKLAATYLNIEVVPMLDFSYGRKTSNDSDGNSSKTTRYRKRGVRIGLGGYAGYRLTSWSKFNFEDNGDKDKTKEKSNYFLNNIRYGVRAQFGYKGTDIFVNYDLNEVFSTGNGPKLNAISFGIIL